MVELALKSTFPWEKRPAEHWTSLVTLPEATRLFYTASKMVPDPWNFFDRYRWIDNFRLNIPLKVYWQNQIDPLANSVYFYGSRVDSHAKLNQNPEIDEIRRKVREVFLETDLSSQLLYERYKDLAFQRNSGLYKKPAIKTNVHNVDSSLLNDLIELCWPTAKKIAFKKKQNFASYLEPGDIEGIAGLALTKLVRNFYWEPIIFDPETTFDHFQSALYSYLHDNANQTFDTRMLETSTERITNYATGYRTENEVIENIDEFVILDLINRFTNDPAETTLLQNKIFYNLSNTEIADQIGINRSRTQRVVAEFRAHLRELSAIGGLDFKLPDNDRPSSLWDDAIANPQKYKEIYDKYRMTLRPFHRQIMELFFTLNSGDKQSTIDSVHQALDHVKRGTIRRQIEKGLNLLVGRERYESQANCSWQRHEEAALLRTVINNHPEFFLSLSIRRQRVIELYYLADSEQTINAVEVARHLGVHESTVSRDLSKVALALRRYHGNPMFNSKILSKSRS